MPRVQEQKVARYRVVYVGDEVCMTAYCMTIIFSPVIVSQLPVDRIQGFAGSFDMLGW